MTGHDDAVRPRPRARRGGTSMYLETASAVTVFILAGRYFEARAKRRAGAALRRAAGARGQGRRGARRRRHRAARAGRRSSPSATASSCGRARRSPPTASSRRARRAVDQSLLTGETVPVEVGPGDEVAGATVNAGGRLVVRATRVGADTALAQIARLVTDAQTGKAPVQRLADRVSAVFVPVVIVLAVATLGFWLGAGEGAGVRVHRRGRRADHRLPVRAGPGDADGAAGRHRPRRAAGAADQGARGAGVHPPRRHHRLGQDRDGDDGPHGVVDVVAPTATDRDEVLRLAGALEDASEHPIAPGHRRAPRASEPAPLPAGGGLRQPRGPRRRGRRRRATACVVGRPALLRRVAPARPGGARCRAARGRGAPGAPRSWSPGTARCAA